MSVASARVEFTLVVCVFEYHYILKLQIQLCIRPLRPVFSRLYMNIMDGHISVEQ